VSEDVIIIIVCAGERTAARRTINFYRRALLVRAHSIFDDEVLFETSGYL
jgi:hypothetical protein